MEEPSRILGVVMKVLGKRYRVGREEDGDEVGRVVEDLHRKRLRETGNDARVRVFDTTVLVVHSKFGGALAESIFRVSGLGTYGGMAKGRFASRCIDRPTGNLDDSHVVLQPKHRRGQGAAGLPTCSCSRHFKLPPSRTIVDTWGREAGGMITWYFSLALTGVLSNRPWALASMSEATSTVTARETASNAMNSQTCCV